ncbi:Wzz/FepE/Etk N-terminal domain-containing protein [Vibrio rotiferianus]|uniref:Wzz/FepE/Etk N-terminal domain-containing protein n=1 Tax=Vibrio rotiferianus TaxID=190895 RepID=UPI002493CA47|nr:Wzz/FepE/Etk N-terminal domain-containing protein [Vibrio rotiferianus]
MTEKQPVTPVELDKLAKHFQPTGLNFGDLIALLWKGKIAIIATTVLFAVISVVVAISLPNIYRSEAVLTPATQDASMSGLSGQLGGLASLAGVSLGADDSNKSKLALEVLKSRSFLADFVNRHHILPDLMAVDEWIPTKNKVVYNSELYDESQQKWIREAEFPRSATPSTQEAYPELLDVLSVTEDKQTGLVRIAVEHQSPYVAKQWVDWLVSDINEEMRTRDLKDATRMVKYLEDKLENTKLADMQSILFQLIEEQTKTIMLAEVMEEYVFKVVDSPVVPELKDSPKRALICVLGTLLGGILGVFFVILRYFIKGEE